MNHLGNKFTFFIKIHSFKYKVFNCLLLQINVMYKKYISRIQNITNCCICYINILTETVYTRMTKKHRTFLQIYSAFNFLTLSLVFMSTNRF